MSDPLALDADGFETALLRYLSVQHHLPVESAQGTNAQYFRTVYRLEPVSFSIIADTRNTAAPPTSGVSWLLRAEGAAPLEFVSVFQPLFKPDTMHSRTMPGGNLRVQWKSSDYIGGSLAVS